MPKPLGLFPVSAGVPGSPLNPSPAAPVARAAARCELPETEAAAGTNGAPEPEPTLDRETPADGTNRAQSANGADGGALGAEQEDEDMTYLDTICDTPLVRLRRALPGAAKHARVLAKLEMQNPGGSLKDRIALGLITGAEAAGKIVPGKTTIIEYTSGNTAIGLAMVCAAKGYSCILVMPQLEVMKERYMICRSFGAEVHLTAPALGVVGMQEHVGQLLRENADFWCPQQFNNQMNPFMHEGTTGPEIWRQSRERVDYFICGIGTGGTVSGVGRYLKEKNPNVKIIAVEPSESRTHVGETHTPHSIVGLGPGISSKFIEALDPGKPLEDGPRGFVDEFQHANSEQAIEWAKRMTRMEGIMVGPSSGAVMHVAAEVAARPEAKGKTIVVIIASHGIRYTHHAMWEHLNAESVMALPTVPDMTPEPLLKWPLDRNTPAAIQEVTKEIHVAAIVKGRVGPSARSRAEAEETGTEASKLTSLSAVDFGSEVHTSPKLSPSLGAAAPPYR